MRYKIIWELIITIGYFGAIIGWLITEIKEHGWYAQGARYDMLWILIGLLLGFKLLLDLDKRSGKSITIWIRPKNNGGRKR